MRQLGIWLVGCGMALAVAGEAAPPSVLLITVDTLRADRLSCYGWSQGRTPAMDDLAASGALFLQAVAPAPLTLPSHAAILTGRLPPELGVRNNGSDRLGPEATTLAELLRTAGYRTGAFVGSYVLDSAFGLGQGFDRYDDELPYRGSQDGPAGVGDLERPAGAVIDAALRWLDEPDPRPFLAWLHLWDPHFPYAPPEPFRSRHAGDPYFGEVAYVDQELGRLFRELRTRGRLGPDTLVVLTADHGESLGEHGEESHGIFLYDATLRVPLIIAFPGRILAGRRLEEPVSLTDLVPTILELVGRDLPRGLTGLSLAGSLTSTKAEPVTERALYLESLYPAENMGWSPLFGLRAGPWKYVLAPRPELYDRRSDPGETRNVLGREPEVARRLERVLRERRSRWAGADRMTPDEPDPEVRERLESLGYVWSGAGRGSSGKERDPKDGIALNQRRKEALALVRAGSVEPGLARLEAVAREDPTNPTLWENLAEAHLAAKRLPLALEAVERGLQVRPDRPNLCLLRGRLLRELGRVEESEGYLRGLLDWFPDPKSIRFELALAVRDRGGDAAALELLRQAEAEGLREPLAPFERGMIHIRAGRTQEAHQAFRRALELDPNLAEAHHNLGVTGRRLGRPEEAEASLREAVRLAPEEVRYRSSYGFLLTGLERWTEARTQLDRALELDPRNHPARNNLAWLLVVAPEGHRDPELALEQVREAIRLTRPAVPPGYLDTYAEALFATGRAAEALAVNTRLREAAPGDAHYQEQRRRFEGRGGSP